MSSARLFVSEDSDSIPFNSFSKSGVQITMVAYNIYRSSHRFLKIFFCFHQQERIGCNCLHKNIYVTTVFLFIPCCRTKKAQ